MNATHLSYKVDSPIPLLENWLLGELDFLEKDWSRSSLKNACQEDVLLVKLESVFHCF